MKRTWGARRGADAHQGKARWRQCGAIGLDGNASAVLGQGIDKGRVELQQWLATGNDHQAVGVGGCWPMGGNGLCQCVGRGVFAAGRAVGAHKVGIAKAADCACAVFFTATPQVAADKAAEHSGVARVGAFSLERVEDFFDAVGHGAAGWRKNEVLLYYL